MAFVILLAARFSIFLVSLTWCHQYFTNGHRLFQETTVSCNLVEFPIVGETKTKVACVGAIQQTQPNQACWHTAASIGNPVCGDSIAKHSILGTFDGINESSQVVEQSILDNDRNVVYTVSLWEGQGITIFIVYDEHASQPIVSLRACFLMGVGVIPGCRSLLSNWQLK